VKRRRTVPVPVLAVALAFSLAALSADGAAPAAASKKRAHVGPTSTTSTVPPTTTTTTEPLGWTAVSRTSAGVAVDEHTYASSDGAQITLVRFYAGKTRFDLHVGSSDPPANAATLPANSGNAISAVEAPMLLAAFNGGFLASDHPGGFQVDWQGVLPLVTGGASFVVDANGDGHVGAWGQDVPIPGETVWSVRQNLSPLVIGGQRSPLIRSIGAWGATLGGGAAVPRSALGEDGQHNIVYAASMSALPVDLADALIAAGAVRAMQLDINPAWVQLALATSPGGPLSAGVPGQNRPATQYVTGWTRDFVAVLDPFSFS
jgi:hypothetical protein